MTEKIQTDVLVIGGGGAGFRAAISARESGAAVLLLSKGPLGRCGATPMAGADFTLDGKSMSRINGLTGDPNDSREKVFNDIVTQGCYLNNQKLVEQYIQRAPQCLQELIDWGIEIKASDQRMVFTSGTGIMDVLVKQARTAGVEMVENVAALELITTDGEIAGAVGLDIRTGGFLSIACKSVVIATGGWHKAFWPNTGMRDLSGEGIAMAQRAGATLGNMEFLTFCCNVFYSPPIWRGSLAPYILSLVCGGRLENRNKEDILKSFDPYMVEVGTTTEWNKSFISHATAREVRQGNGLANNGVGYCRGDVPWENIELVASFLFPKWRYKAIDLKPWSRMLEENEIVEVGPAVEYFDGGIVVDDKFQSTVPGLYAAGECTLGAFGANRVFSAITEMLVHGVDAGRNAADHASQKSIPMIAPQTVKEVTDDISAPLHSREGIRPAGLRRSIQEQAHQSLGPIRSHQELNRFLLDLETTQKEKLPLLATVSDSPVYNKEWLDAIELKNMIQLLKASTLSALHRTESRGVHFREDFPETDNDNWLKESMAVLSNEVMTISNRDIITTNVTPPQGKAPYLRFIRKMMESHSDTGGKH